MTRQMGFRCPGTAHPLPLHVMSRDIVDRRTHGTLVVERLVAPGGVEGEVAEEFAFLAEDSDVEVGDEDDDASSGTAARVGDI